MDAEFSLLGAQIGLVIAVGLVRGVVISPIEFELEDLTVPVVFSPHGGQKLSYGISSSEEAEHGTVVRSVSR